MTIIPVRKLVTRHAHVGIHVRTLEEIADGKDLRHEQHRHDHYFFLIIEKGRGKHEIDLVPHAVTNMQVFVVRPGQIHQLELHRSSRGYIISVDAAMLRRIDDGLRLIVRRACRRSVYSVDRTSFDRMNSILRLMHRELTERASGYEYLLPSHLLHFLVELSRQHTHDGSTEAAGINSDLDKLDILLALVEDHAIDHWTTSDYARTMKMSVRQLDAFTRHLLGTSVSRLATDALTMEAKRRLAATSDTITSIAYELGFEDPSYFVRHFRRHTGYTPLRFREDTRRNRLA